MIKSMTGYGKSSYLDEKIDIDIEIKTVNSRFLDINIKMPYQLNFMEDKIKKLIKEYVKRGRIDVFIKSKSNNLGNTNIVVDENQAKKMYEALNLLTDMFDIKGEYNSIRISDLLKNEEIIKFEAQPFDEEYISKVILDTLNDVLIKLSDMRIKEGKNLREDLLSNLEKLISYRDEISKYEKNIKVEIRDRLYENINEILEDFDINEDRLANEIVFYADRQDINEELSRLESHFKQFKSNLDSDESVGKKLDFITQEMLRETNTIGSKTSKIEVTNHIIEMKTTIEKIKEQVQNIE